MNYFSIEGTDIEVENCQIESAKRFIIFLKSFRVPTVTLVNSKRNEKTKHEAVIFDIETEIGQKCIHDIKHRERIAVLFSNKDELPEVQALRKDFPRVPHLMLREQELPRSLCLFYEPYVEIKSNLTPFFLLRRISEWLRLTSRNELHQDDQPLEPLFLNYSGTIVVSDLLLAKKANGTFQATKNNVFNDKVLFEIKDQAFEKGKPLVFTYFIPPYTHGIIYQEPNVICDIQKLFLEFNFDIIEHLKKDLKKNFDNLKNFNQEQLIILLHGLVRKTDDSFPETHQKYAFLFEDSIGDLGEKLGIWENTTLLGNHQRALLLKEEESGNLSNIRIQGLRVICSFFPFWGRILNGDDTQKSPQIALIGVGALGSQMLFNLARAGYGRWILVDSDYLLPHNLARHALSEKHLYNFKVLSLREELNTMLGTDYIYNAIAKDVLSLDSEELESVGQAEMIIDISTSLAVERYLVHEVKSLARRISMFLTPAGVELVILAEDTTRVTQLDFVEMYYYRLLYTKSELEGHLNENPELLLYSNSCRDFSSKVGQDFCAIYGGICSKKVKELEKINIAFVEIWRAQENGMQKYTYAVKTPMKRKHGDWEIFIDDELIERNEKLRKEKLPNETGGVLIGAFDLERKIIYIMDAIESPPDSTEHPTFYIRGSKGLEQIVRNIENHTAQKLHYIGEWHSHPDGCSTAQSNNDKNLLDQISKYMSIDGGYPAVMIIIGENGYDIFIK